MAVVKVSTKADGWNGSAESQRNGLLYEVLRRRYRLTKLVYTNNAADGPEVILTSVGVPQIGDQYAIFNDSDTLATCVAVSPRQTGNPLLWEVDCDFDTDRVVASVSDHPLSQPALVTWSFQKYTRPLQYDIYGVAGVNSSGEKFDPPLEFDESRPLLTIERNEATFSPSNAVAYMDACNLNTFAGAAQYCAKINNITGKQQFSNGLFYYQVTYEIEFRRETFALFVLDQGFRDYQGQLFRDPVDFAPLSNPTLLNGRGRRRTDAVGALTAPMDATQTTIQFSNPNLFPPGVEPVGSGGFIPSGDWYFTVLVDDEKIMVTQTKDIQSVAPPWTCVRGVQNTTAATHANGAQVTLEPYFGRLLPYKMLDYAPLSLPTI